MSFNCVFTALQTVCNHRAVEWSRRQKRGNAIGHGGSMCVIWGYFGTLQAGDWSAVPRSGRRKRRDVSGRHPMRKRDIHVSISRSEGFHESRRRGNEGKLIVENGARERSAMA